MPPLITVHFPRFYNPLRTCGRGLSYYCFHKSFAENADISRAHQA